MADIKTIIIMKTPSSLYLQCLKTYVKNINKNVVVITKLNILRHLPPIVLADIYLQMSTKAELKDILGEELSNLVVFSRILKFGPARQKMFPCLSSLMLYGKPIASDLKSEFILQTNLMLYEIKYNTEFSKKEILDQIDTGLRLGTFLAEAGWIEESIHVLSNISPLIDTLVTDYTTLVLKLDCLQRLLHAQANFCCFKEASCTVKEALALVDKISIENVPNSLLANLYIQISFLHFLRSEYDLSYSWSIKALKRLRQDTPDKIAIDVLRHASKSCVIKRQFKRAHMLITQACRRASTVFSNHHQKYADALLDYGFFLLNVDSIIESVRIYDHALQMRSSIFGQRNFHVAIAHEDLAYALYVQEYSSGRFQNANKHIEKAINIMMDLVPSHNLRLASAKRVKALILEEIALDILGLQSPESDGLLKQSEDLHRSALQLSLEAFGEVNVQTAKHYGNLGRLYQSMTKYEEAEKMHQRAIKIKTDLLGAYDYEVGLSTGHLASLYNYHMKKHREAEELYLRSIAISLRLFGKTYSGLEYDYRGLCHVYEALGEFEKCTEYHRILDIWKELRENFVAHSNQDNLFFDLKEDTSMEEVTKKFFEMCTECEPIVM